MESISRHRGGAWCVGAWPRRAWRRFQASSPARGRLHHVARCAWRVARCIARCIARCATHAAAAHSAWQGRAQLGQCMARPRPTWQPAAAQAGLRALFSLRRCSRRAVASRARAFLALPRPGNGSGSQGVTVVSETRRAGERSASGSGTGGGGVGSGGGELCKHVGTGSVASARKANTPSRLPRAPQTGSSPRAASP